MSKDEVEKRRQELLKEIEESKETLRKLKRERDKIGR